MTARLGTVILAALVVMMIAAATAAHGGPTRTRLWAAMHRYATCRAADGARFANDLSAAQTGGQVAFVTVMSNGAALMVKAGKYRHVVVWTTAHGVRYVVLRSFSHLYTVAPRLRAACP